MNDGLFCDLAPQVHELLKSRFGVSHECFASPLNAFFPSFCSAFPDTDAAFGSAGSFWTWEPDFRRGGGYEVNPPFVADVMLSMAERLDGFLGREGAGGITFVVVVPGWLDDPGIRAMMASPFKRFDFTIPKADHGFCDGLSPAHPPLPNTRHDVNLECLSLTHSLTVSPADCCSIHFGNHMQAEMPR